MSEGTNLEILLLKLYMNVRDFDNSPENLEHVTHCEKISKSNKQFLLKNKLGYTNND